MKRRSFLGSVLAALSSFSLPSFSTDSKADVVDIGHARQMKKAFKKQIDNLTEMPALLYYVIVDESCILGRARVMSFEYRNDMDIANLSKYYSIGQSGGQHGSDVIPFLTRKA